MAQLTIQQAFDLAFQHHQAGRLQEAERLYRQVLTQQPAHVNATHLLGVISHRTGRIDIAVDLIRRAIDLKPEFPEAYNNLGIALKDKGRLDEAIAAYRQAIGLQPNRAQAHSNLGNALKDKGRLDEAIAAYGQAIALSPRSAQIHNNLANALRDNGQFEQAIAAYRQAIAIDPDDAAIDSNFLYALHYQSAYSAQGIAEEHRRWNRQHAQPLRKFIQPHGNDPNPDRRLRIGYVSADFWNHPVGRFLLPLLEHHDHQQFEVLCYSNNVVKPDAISARIRSCADHWREIIRLSDQEAADQIRDDTIDILVDLSGHTSRNRLLIFAQKPAPVQVSYLGYPGTTGLSTIDFRLTDGLADPVDLPDRFDTDVLYHLPHTNWCFAAPEDSPPVEPTPAIRAGHVMFGSSNNFTKVTEAMVEIWGRILRRVPGSGLLLKSALFATASGHERVRRIFAAQDVDASRLNLCGPQPDHASHLALHGQIDIALDTFPYHGTATTCDALWMGLPVITLAGQTHVARVGRSLLSNIGLPELVAFTPDQYVQIAADLAKDPARIDALRRGMRARMLASPLMDALGFARDVEAAYRQMWRKWCETGASTTD